MYVALGGLYLEAIRSGMDVSACFQKAAQLSSSIAGPSLKTSMREFLAEFEQSAFFVQTIQPKLPRQ
jgi:hypothetical protein